MANYRKFFSGLAKEDRAARAQLFQKQVEIIGALYRSGNSIPAGTDGGQPYNPPGGFWLHDELRLLVNAGLKPMDALRSATSKAAEFADKADSFGTIEAGKVADLVLLDASPLEDIANTALPDADQCRRENVNWWNGDYPAMWIPGEHARGVVCEVLWP